ncbi:MAG: aminotransferase [Geminicoccaceae bacterium]
MVDDRSVLANRTLADDIRDWDNTHLFHPWESMGTAAPDRLIAAHGDGIYLVDAEGRKFIDGPGGMWNVQLGYGNREMADAIATQAMSLPYQSPWTFASEPSALLAKKLADIAPGDLNTVFFTTGGSTANDSALRFVQFYNNLKGRPEKKIILSREKAYHGSTYLAATVSGKERDKGFLDTERRLVRFLPNVNPYVRPRGMTIEDWCDKKVADLERTILDAGPDKVAAFIAEPILASGGVIVPPAGYHKRAIDVCRKYEVLYISDEVVTAFGRLGHWFASEDVFEIVPDIIVCAKGMTSGYLPLGAMVVSDRLLDDIRDEGRAQILFANGYTNSAHPVCCAAALKTIEIIEREDILGHVREVAPQFQSRLQTLARHDIIGDARGIGLLGCLEGDAGKNARSEEERLRIDKDFGACMDAACEARGLLVRPIINMCVFSPPLIITSEQIETLFDILDDAIVEVQQTLME